jgi:hypothetical protein
MKTYIYIGVFEKGLLITSIGNRILLPSDKSSQSVIIATISTLIDLIDQHYKPFNNEYIAYDYIHHDEKNQ